MRSKLTLVAESGNLVFNQNLRISHLSKAGRIEEAVHVFEKMTRRNTVTWNSMISGCAKNGRVVDARRLFDQMPVKNLVSWNTMLAGYLHNDLVSEAAELFDRMPRRDLFSWTLMITCYTRVGDLGKAMHLFTKLPEKQDPVCWNAIVAGYGKNKQFKEARKLFDEMPVKDLISYNSMLAGYTQNEEMRLASDFFNQMSEKDVVSWNLMIEGFVKVGDLDTAGQFFGRIPSPNVVSWVTMLSAYARNARVVEARRLFDVMPIRNVVAWNAMITGYVQNLQLEEGYRLFLEMPGRNSITWTSMIDGFVRVGLLDKARELLEKMPYKNVAAQTAIIYGYVQSMRLDEARLLFDQIGCRDTVCWNTMIGGYAQSGRMDDAIDLMLKMPKKDVVSWNILIAGYSQTGEMSKAVEVFDRMVRKNLVSWNSLVSGLTQNGFYTDALRYFLVMNREGMKPDHATFACVLSACANLAALQVGRQLHHLILKSGHLNNLFVGNGLITLYSKCGKVIEAKQMFDEMLWVDIISWNSLIAGYAMNGHGKQAIQLFLELETDGLSPDEVTFVGVLSACSHAGLIDKGVEIFHSMTSDYSITPVAEHYSCMVDLLGRAGRLEEAYKLVMAMPVEVNAGTWGALLGASRIHCNLDLAKIAAEKLLELEPYKTSNYVTLSNIHAEAGRWDQVERVRKLMKERGVIKQPGCSWIEVNNRVQAFFADDPTQARLSEVCETLKRLTVKMRIIGYIPEVDAGLVECG
ncbi:pentatricopeptide repeat-containing protein At4g02750-like [Aristolochia californica]|uniref:pentatricopeptide repeat-containing protein At4g02750-like n=1 Tax=Aristolochia californica TaxID=171875 RepID=UPI0035DB6D52